MILSFHPCFTGDKNIICAGRAPGSEELSAIKAADAVILSQGCSQALYEMARAHCSNVFPNYDARFQYPGKIGQIRLFQKINLPHPCTRIYLSTGEVLNSSGEIVMPPVFDFPFVFKYPWGGEGETVFLIRSKPEFGKILNQAADYEQAGHKGFLIQEYISTIRSLRIVQINETICSYWRVMDSGNHFGTSVAGGARIDADADPDLQKQAVCCLKNFCENTGINLAGFDILFSDETETKQPFFIEINYFFGRKGLGGSEKFYELLETEIKKWLNRFGLSVGRSTAL